MGWAKYLCLTGRPIRADEAQMELAIATNPHLKDKDQKKLWAELKRGQERPKRRKMTPDRRAQGEALQKQIDEGKR